MATLYEYYNTGDDSARSFHDISWVAQTFTPSTAHKITSVKLKLYRVGSPGTITVGIRATDGSGHPTGEDLCSGTTDGDTLTSDSGGEWREVTLGAGYNLSASTKYAIVVRATSGDADNDGHWRADGSSPTYSGGIYEYSINSGAGWTIGPAYDLMFEDWGVEAYTKTVSIDALLRATDTEAISLDALLKTIESKTIDLDAILKAIDTETISLDALIKALGISKTVALDIILGLPETVTVNLDALIRARDLESISVDTLLRGLDTKTITLDAYIKAINLIESVNLDMLIAELGITKTVALDALLKGTGEQTIDLDTLLKGGATSTVLLDVILGEILVATASVSLDVILFKALPPNRIYTIEIRNGAGELLAILENAHGISYAQIINSPYPLTFDLPSDDSKASSILLANECWLRDNRTDTVIRKLKLQRKMDTRT